MIDRTKLSLLFIAVTFTLTVSSSLTSNKTSAQVTVKTTNAATPTPTPSVTPVAERSRQTLASLQSVIAGRLSRSEVRRGRVGVKIVSLNTGKTVYEQDGDKYFMPASDAIAVPQIPMR